ncbi:MAG: hypothetical protein ACXAC5_01695 [Promethearchaeota archaeon]|jgi:hypothetical protein
MYDPQPIQQQDKVRAYVWYEEHKTHVDRLVDTCSGEGYPPCGSDCIRPEVWKPNHWKWLLEVCASVHRSRTLVRVTQINDSMCKVIVPGWHVRQEIPLTQEQVPPEIWDLLTPDKRLHAHVNIGADSAEDLTFSNWERE